MQLRYLHSKAWLALGVGAVASTLVACSPGSSPQQESPHEEQVGSASEAVGQGMPTGPDNFKFVVQVNLPDGTCSGILVAPRWVLTANHCITGGFSFFGDDSPTPESVLEESLTILVTNQIAGCNGAPHCRFRHTFQNSGKILLNVPHPINSAKADDFDLDLALIKLDDPVPSSVAEPAILAGLTAATPPCPGRFDGTLVGFGPTDGFGSMSPSPDRNATFSNNWTRAEHDGHWSYENGWDPIFQDYQGLIPGDSGGPLILSPTPNVVCGVNSKAEPFDAVEFQQTSDDAAVDSPVNLAFLRPNLLGVEGGLCIDGSQPSTQPPVFDASVLTPGTSGCFPNAPFGFVPLPFPTATSTCTPGNVTVTGKITELNGVPVFPPIPITSSTSAGPPGVHQYTVFWTATDGTGSTATATQVINTPELGTSIDTPPATPPLVTSCTAQGLEVAIPVPHTTTATGCEATLTGAITAANFQVLATPIPIAADGTVVAPVGSIVVTWTATDSLGFVTQTRQPFEVQTLGPCFAQAGSDGWTATAGGPVTAGTQPGGGPGAALEIVTTMNWNAIVSSFNTTGLVTGNNLEFDLYLPPNLASQAWWGGVTATISLPDANLFNVYLGGNNDLKGSNLPLGAFSTIKIPLPNDVISALSTGNNNVKVEIDLNSPAGPPAVGPWFVQNFRFGN